jgi:hypothetical protein
MTSELLGGGLASWRDGPAKQAIVAFVAHVCGEDGSEPVPVEERIAVFDNDGTLWCEKPMPIQLDFILRRLVEMAEADPGLRERQPWKAAHERDYGWLSQLSAALAYTSDERGGTITHKPELDYLDDGPQKPIRIWSRTGRRPLLAAGNSNGDVPMLHFTQHHHKPSLRLLVLHDDAEREFAYTTGAEQALAQAASHGWTVISVKHDWATVS